MDRRVFNWKIAPSDLFVDWKPALLSKLLPLNILW